MNGKGARYTKMHKPKKLVYTEEFDYRAEAMKRERKVKTMGHEQKMHLMKSQTKKTRKKSRRDKQQ